LRGDIGEEVDGEYAILIQKLFISLKAAEGSIILLFLIIDMRRVPNIV
jgi:hypothetical protein